MTKRIICWLTMLLLLAGAVCAHGEEETAGQVYDHLTAASTTHMQGEFFTDMWGNATSDIDVRDLLHGYDLVAWDGSQGMFAPDPSVVSGIAATANDQGDTSFVLALQDDLYYSDGTKITAWDYAFSFLFQIAPEIAELGGQPQRKAYLLGYDEYVSGKAETLTGVRVPSDHTLMVTISHEYLPFFYEMGLLSCRPYPIKAIAPGVRVVDDGTGVCLKNEDPTAEEQFTVQKLLETVCNPETGYRSHPSVVSGPYTLESWDGETAEFAINPYFKGDRNGKLPLIPKLTYTVCTNETMIDGLQSGQYDLLNKVMKADTIQTALAGMSAGGYQMSSYPRIGLSYISFCCEKEAVAGQAVRQAIAWCMDRDQFTADYTGNFGLRSDGYYGVGQWMYGVMNGSTAPPVEKPENENDKKAAEAYDEAMAAWEQLSMDGLTVYTADPGKAQELLDQDGWTLNPEGIREKEINGQKVTLDLKLIYPEGSAVAASFAACFVPNLEAVGIRLTMEPVEMTKLLDQYYRKAPRDADMIFLASNFDLVFDPSAGFKDDGQGEHSWFYTALKDEELYRLAVDLRRTEPGDTLGYCQKWIAFQERFNETLPMLPLYTNVYFDFYTQVLRQYNITEQTTWSQAILGAFMSDEVEEQTEDLDDAEFID